MPDARRHNKLSEIAILGHENYLLAFHHLEHGVIGRARINFDYPLLRHARLPATPAQRGSRNSRQQESAFTPSALQAPSPRARSYLPHRRWRPEYRSR